MAGLSPAPLPSLGSLFDPAGTIGSAGAPFALPSIGLLLGTSAGRAPLTASAGAFALTGNAATLKGGRKFAGAAGSYSFTGVDATLTKGSPNFGVGAPAPLPSLSLLLERSTDNKLFAVSAGAFSLTSIATTLTKGHGLAAGAGSFLWTVAPAQRDIQVTADKTTFAYTANAATLTKASPGIVATNGSYVLTGGIAALVYQPVGTNVLSAFPGAFALTGNDAALPSTIARVLLADKGTFALAGVSTVFQLIGWAPVSGASSTWTNVTNSGSTWNNV
jgi:hypothetical protein